MDCPTIAKIDSDGRLLPGPYLTVSEFDEGRLGEVPE